MPGIDDLPADRKAVLQLLLKQGKSYDDLAGLLRIAPETVRERAHDAVLRLGPADGAGLDRSGQDEVADYLLGQQTASERAATRRFLEGSSQGRAWARVVSGELRPLAGDALPDIPSEREEVYEAFDALEARKEARVRQQRSSRLGGVLLLAAVGIAVAFIIVFVVSGSSDDNGSTKSSSNGSTTSTTSSTPGQPQVLGQVNLKPPSGSSSKALAIAALVRQNDETDIVFQGQNITPNTPKQDVYALWAVGSSGAARLGFTPTVKSNGRLRFTGALPSNVDLSKYSSLELTRETSANPSKPGTEVIAGKLP
jgi:hypothetical protein